MNKQKIAILVDSGTDVPQDYVEKYDITVLPLKVIYKEREYLSGVDISAEEIYARLKEEIPKTSLPSYHDVVMALENIKNKGYEKVLAITISSGLSGTFNSIRLAASEFEGLEVHMVDTKNISIGAGFTVMHACDLIEEGKPWGTITKEVDASVPDSKVYFCIPTLEYLQKGGRIGLVASLLGNVLGLKPIISCNDEGIYYTVEKVIGWRKTVQKTIELAAKFAARGKKYNICLVYGQLTQEVKNISKLLKETFIRAEEFRQQQVSPALGVHTGPGVIGIGMQVIH